VDVGLAARPTIAGPIQPGMTQPVSSAALIVLLSKRTAAKCSPAALAAVAQTGLNTVAVNSTSHSHPAAIASATRRRSWAGVGHHSATITTRLGNAARTAYIQTMVS
jgi:hypothetical protein